MNDVELLCIAKAIGCGFEIFTHDFFFGKTAPERMCCSSRIHFTLYLGIPRSKKRNRMTLRRERSAEVCDMIIDAMS